MAIKSNAAEVKGYGYNVSGISDCDIRRSCCSTALVPEQVVGWQVRRRIDYYHLILHFLL